MKNLEKAVDALNMIESLVSSAYELLIEGFDKDVIDHVLRVTVNDDVIIDEVMRAAEDRILMKDYEDDEGDDYYINTFDNDTTRSREISPRLWRKYPR